MKFNEIIGIAAFYTIFLGSIVTISFGVVSFDKIIIGVGISLFACAFLMKSEFRLEVMFWKNF